jgi:hypothetical protein
MPDLELEQSYIRARVTYSASAVKKYNATSGPVRFENKNSFIYFNKNAPAYYNSGVAVVNLEVQGLAPEKAEQKNKNSVGIYAV